MKRSVFCLLALVLVFMATASLASAQATPTFKLGFKALADQIPATGGTPMENEHWGANGDSLQQTTTGLMVWRKADNWTAFTNGSRTWINGPFGVQERGNLERFDWEQVGLMTPPAAADPAPIAPPLPTATPTDPVVWNIDKPRNGAVIAGAAEVSGWAFDRSGESLAWNAMDDFQVYLDAPMGSGGRRVDTSHTHLVRSDVGASFGKPVYSNSGYSMMLSLEGVAPGSHRLHVYVRSQLSGWRNKQVDVTVQEAMVSKEKAEQAMLKVSDLPSNYRATSFGWTDSTTIKADYETNDILRNPFVGAQLQVMRSPTEAQMFFDAMDRLMSSDHLTATIPLAHVSSSRGYVQTFSLSDGTPGTHNYVYFVFRNVCGYAKVTGLAQFTHINQAVTNAQSIVNRLAAP